MKVLSKTATKPTTKKRILNELGAKITNEESADRATELKNGSNKSDRENMLFGCECDTKDCPARISISTQEYDHVHTKNMRFIVVPTHVHLDIERIVATFPEYSIVEKRFPVTSV